MIFSELDSALVKYLVLKKTQDLTTFFSLKMSKKQSHVRIAFFFFSFPLIQAEADALQEGRHIHGRGISSSSKVLYLGFLKLTQYEA